VTRLHNRARRYLTMSVVAVAAAAVTATVVVDATATRADPIADGSRQTPQTKRLAALLPDLTPLRAVDVSITRTGQARAIRFQAGLASIGTAPMEVRPDNRRACAQGKRHSSQIIYRDVDANHRFNRGIDTRFTRHSSGCMVYHPTHNHWHFQAASRYLIYKAGHIGNSIRNARKMSFCLRDSMRVPPRYGTFNSALYYRECSRNSPQGISRGWVDVYASYLSGQSIPIPPRVNRGFFCLAIRVDPLNRLLEDDETNNRSVRALHIRGKNVQYAATRRCR